MSSPHRYSEDNSERDEFDRLLRRALQGLAGKQEPPERVWNGIRAALEKDKGPPRRFLTSWLSVAVQPAMTLLLVMLGAVGLGILLNTEAVYRSAPAPAPSLAMDYVAELPVPVDLVKFDDEAELRSLKAVFEPGGIREPDAQPASQPPVSVPRDPFPNVLSPEGRALLAELALRRVAVEERTLLHSGPYRWDR
jgi:hypothetical protein